MTAADADSVGRVGFEAWAANPVLNAYGVDMMVRIRLSFRRFAQDRFSLITIGELGGEIAGWTAREGARDYISDLWVSPAHQGLGIGSAQAQDATTYPFDGFDVHPIYDDFTTPTFDDRHAIIKGGSWIATGNESRHASRYAFRRHFFQHAGFRYIVSEAPVLNPASTYETDALLSQYAEFHYGDEAFGVPNFPKALADIAISASIAPLSSASPRASRSYMVFRVSRARATSSSGPSITT